MKITKTQLRQIIKEEVENIVSERFKSARPELKGDGSLSGLSYINDPEKSNLYKLPPGAEPNEKNVGYRHGYPEQVDYNTKLKRWETRLGEPLLGADGKLRRPTHDEMDKTIGVEKKVSKARATKPSKYDLEGLGRPGGKGKVDNPYRAKTRTFN